MFKQSMLKLMLAGLVMTIIPQAAHATWQETAQQVVVLTVVLKLVSWLEPEQIRESSSLLITGGHSNANFALMPTIKGGIPTNGERLGMNPAA